MASVHSSHRTPTTRVVHFTNRRQSVRVWSTFSTILPNENLNSDLCFHPCQSHYQCLKMNSLFHFLFRWIWNGCAIISEQKKRRNECSQGVITNCKDFFKSFSLPCPIISSSSHSFPCTITVIYNYWMENFLWWCYLLFYFILQYLS